MSVTYHSSVDVVKQLQYVEETTYGTTPSSPSFTNAGAIQEVNETTNDVAKRYFMLGAEGIYTQLLCGQLFSFSLRYNPTANSTAFIRYGTEASGGGTGTIDKSLSMLISNKLNAVENYVLFKGCRTDSITFEATPEDLTVSQNWICSDITTPSSTHGLTTPTFGSTYSGTPLCSVDGGTNPLTINSLNYDCTRFSFTVNRNVDARRINGKLGIIFATPGHREITVDLDILAKDTATIADVKTMAARSASYVLDNANAKSATFTNLILTNYNRVLSADSTDTIIYSFSGSASTVTITA